MYTYTEGSEITDQVAHAVYTRVRELKSWLERAEIKKRDSLIALQQSENDIFRLKNDIEECEDFLKTRA